MNELRLFALETLDKAKYVVDDPELDASYQLLFMRISDILKRLDGELSADYTFSDYEREIRMAYYRFLVSKEDIGKEI